MTSTRAMGASGSSRAHGAPEAKQVLREVMGHYATGAAIVTSTWQGRPHGLAVNSFTSVSLEPPLVAFCPDKGSETWPAIRDADFFGINILACEQSQLCRQFARKGADRFSGIGYTETSRGCPALPGVLAYIECRLDQVIDAGDHYIAVSNVLEMSVNSEALQPLVFYQGGFRRLEPAPLQG